ncbi:MAG: hypothetical protein K2M46_07275 [Lachnospiraceae bacterium]|nr:hypothetical protein [Lachnospiraceae bacterium]
MKKTMTKLIFTMAALLCFTLCGTSNACVAQAATSTKTIYFQDGTPEKWISNDAAIIELVDNTNGHDSYIMTKVSDTEWRVTVPATATNITFNRWNSDHTTLWNSWSTGPQDGKNTYVAVSSSYGYWE